MSPAADAMVVEDLTVRFGVRTALDHLSLRAEAGRVTAVLGPNGAGKSTLIRCCTGLISPTAGRIRILAEPAGSASVAARVGLMPQGTGAWSGVRAGELLRYLASLYADPLPVPALMERVGVAEVAGVPYRRLSGGQQQAVNLAGALVGRPDLVFLDEPTAGLDPHARRRTWSLLRELAGAGVAVVLATHAMDEAAALADRVHILDSGRVVLSGTVAELTAGGQSLEDVFLARTRAGAGW